MNFLKELNKKLYQAFFFVGILFLFSSCKKETKIDYFQNYLARVDDNLLTEQYAKIYLDTIDINSEEYKTFVKDWIENQIILKECEKKGILQSRDYLRAMELSKFSIARSILLNKVLEEIKIETPENDLKNFYEKYKEDFALSFDAYQYNSAIFRNKQDAIVFRNFALDYDWNTAITLSQKKGLQIINFENEALKSEYEIEPMIIVSAFRYLKPNEISVALQVNENLYVVAQLLKKFERGEYLDFEYAKDRVKEKYKVLKTNNYLREYLSNLYKNYNIEIK